MISLIAIVLGLVVPVGFAKLTLVLHQKGLESKHFTGGWYWNAMFFTALFTIGTFAALTLPVFFHLMDWWAWALRTTPVPTN